ncbi:hypothetical protein CYLTODRAFT_44063 [Cylindrobasidium torrendii FP15055 ss-10]|uniref:BTB domain-containing protein n=1 Tax=Cylindrobasidium torrendii FP15055 ss-10 TaxID=1314674 RepID=A0A0D7B755_9AGAR|nr:hypothetical protein CYLTODRAFT_44063 [Cylindrobasidium torrendii FP15055 ss-10]
MTPAEPVDPKSGAEGDNVPVGDAVRSLPTPPVRLPSALVRSRVLNWQPQPSGPTDLAEDESVVSTSTTFSRGNLHSDRPADLVLISTDAVYFYVHVHVLHDASGNGFSSLLEQLSATRSPSEISLIRVPEKAEVINVILLAIYHKSIADYKPTFDTMLEAVREFDKYKINHQRYVRPGTPLFELIRFYMPLHPLDVYALAAHYELEELAVAASSHLLGYKLSTITNETVKYMGPVYVRRLYDLHMGRSEALKKVLIIPPEPHPSTAACSFMDQTKVARAWALSSAYLIWEARPDMSASYIESTLNQLKQSMSCDNCKKRVEERIRRCVVDWSSVKWTI